MGTLKPQSQQYGDWYPLAVDGWAVTFGTARRGLGGLAWLGPVSSLLYRRQHPTH